MGSRNITIGIAGIVMAGLLAAFAPFSASENVKVALVPTMTLCVAEAVTGTPATTVTHVPIKPKPSIHTLKCSKTHWRGTNGQWDKIATATLKLYKLSAPEIRMAMWIHHHEGGPNSINRGSYCYGGWQLSRGMARGHKWWCPVWETKRVVRYMRGRYGSIAKAYRFKRSHGWY